MASKGIFASWAVRLPNRSCGILKHMAVAADKNKIGQRKENIMGKIILVLTVLLASDIVFEWGLPLGGVVFLVWFLLAGIAGSMWKDELKKLGDSQPVDVMCCIFWWIAFIGVLCLGNSILSTIIGIVFIITGVLLVVVRGGEWETSGNKVWHRRKHYVCLFYAIFVPLAIFLLIQAVRDFLDREK